MATKPTLNLPEWASSEPVGTNVIEPTSRKTTGYTKNLQGIPEKPTYQELNFLLKSNYEWTQYLEDATDEINLITVTAGEALTANDAIRLSGGLAYKADDSTSSGVANVIGFVTQTTALNDPATIAVRYWNGFSGLNAGNRYYIGASGAITDTPTGYIGSIGIAINATTIYLDAYQEDLNKYKNYVSIKTFNPYPGLVTIGSSYSVIYYSELAYERSWINNRTIQNKVDLILQFTGPASSPSTLQCLIERSTNSGSTWTNVFESNTFDIFNPGFYEYNDVLFNLHTGNSTNWDIYSAPVHPINDQSLGLRWRLSLLGSGTTPKLNKIMFAWNK